MKLLKKIAIGLAILLVLLALAIFLVPQGVQLEESKEISAPPQTVFNIINDMTMEAEWNPWQQEDTSMVVTYGDVTSGVGANYSWVSDNMGKGSARYTAVEKNSKIVSALDFDGMGGGEATYTLTPTESGGTKVTWDLNSKTQRPWNLMNLMIKSSTKKSYRKGLESLEKIAIQRHKAGMYRGYQVKEELVEGRTYVTNRDVVAMDKVQQFYAQSLGPLFQKIQIAGLEIAGHPSGLVYNYDMTAGTMDMAAGVPITDDVAIQGTNNETIATRSALVIDYYGDYADTEIAHQAIDDYLADRELSFDWPVIEEYVTDPSEEPNPSKWLTRIIYFISE